MTEKDPQKSTILSGDFVVNRIDLKRIVKELVDLEKLTASQEVDINDDQDNEWLDESPSPMRKLTTNNSSCTIKT